MYNFNYHRPMSVEEAVQFLSAASDGKLMGGGMTLIPTFKQRLANPSDVIDLGQISTLNGITQKGEAIVIGATTRHAQVAADRSVRSKIPALVNLAEGIGDPQVRNRGTIGGSLANNDPAADYPAAVLGLGATVKTNQREIAADAYFTGMFETALEEGEIITAVSFPVPKKAGYAKFPNPASRYAIVGVMASQGPEGVRVAVTGAGPVVFRLIEIEKALERQFSADAVKDFSISPEGLNSDIHASAEYRAHLVGVMARRAIAAAG